MDKLDIRDFITRGSIACDSEVQVPSATISTSGISIINAGIFSYWDIRARNVADAARHCGRIADVSVVGEVDDEIGEDNVVNTAICLAEIVGKCVVYDVKSICILSEVSSPDNSTRLGSDIKVELVILDHWGQLVDFCNTDHACN